MRTRVALAIVTALLFLACAFGVGYSTGTGTVNRRLDCRQGRDDQAIAAFVKLILSDGHQPDPGVVAQLKRLPTNRC